MMNYLFVIVNGARNPMSQEMKRVLALCTNDN